MRGELGCALEVLRQLRTARSAGDIGLPAERLGRRPHLGADQPALTRRVERDLGERRSGRRRHELGTTHSERIVAVRVKLHARKTLGFGQTP